MSAVHFEFQRSSNYGTDPVVLSPEALVEKISSITAEGIEAIAKKVISLVMGRMRIDVLNVIIELSPEVQTPPIQVYRPNSNFMLALLPPVKNLIENAFSTPSEFAEQGLKLSFINTEHTGLVEQIDGNEDLKQEIMRNIELLKQHYNPDNLILEIHLKLSSVHSAEELTFTTSENMNLGKRTAFHLGTIRDFERSAQNSTVHQ